VRAIVAGFAAKKNKPKKLGPNAKIYEKAASMPEWRYLDPLKINDIKPGKAQTHKTG